MTYWCSDHQQWERDSPHVPDSVSNELHAEIERLKADRQALANNVERAINILTPLFVAYQELGNPNEELLGGALDVLTGWFGQNGQPLRRVTEMSAEIKRLRAVVDAVVRLKAAATLTGEAPWLPWPALDIALEDLDAGANT